MNIAIIGSGGREHALCWRLSKENKNNQIFCIPGNDGISKAERVHCFNIKPVKENWKIISKYLISKKIELCIIGPEIPLIEGMASYLRVKGIKVLGPSQRGAQLEASKHFSKTFMKEASIPTSDFRYFKNSSEAITFVTESSWQGYVVKLDMVAQGKGVIVCKNKEETLFAIDSLMIRNSLNVPSTDIIIEKVSPGKEVSAFMIMDDTGWKYLGDSCDYKRIRDNDEGPNTGGMGTYSPAHWLSNKQKESINSICEKTFIQMKKSNICYQGIIFIGLMVDNENLNVLEYNIRFGDPETQSLILTLDGSLTDLLSSCAKNNLDECRDIQKNKLHALHIVMASKGYPGTEGVPILLDQKINFSSDKQSPSQVFYSGVKEIDQTLYTSAGRVLGLTSVDETHIGAFNKAYRDIEDISFNGAQRRSDIGK